MDQHLSLAPGLVVFDPTLAIEIAAPLIGRVPLPIARLAVGALCWSALLVVAWLGTPSQPFRDSARADVDFQRR